MSVSEVEFLNCWMTGCYNCHRVFALLSFIWTGSWKGLKFEEYLTSYCVHWTLPGLVIDAPKMQNSWLVHLELTLSPNKSGSCAMKNIQ